jgi:dTDP-L-rhamnose 4-epimerase
MKWENVGVLVTGGAGLIGSHLVDALIEKGARVAILDNLDAQTHPNGKPDWISPKARFIHGDVRNKVHLADALKNTEYVYHQAAFGGFTPELAHYVDANATGTARLFEVIRDEKFPIKKIVVASSQAVYGEGTYRDERGALHFPRQLRPVQQLNEGRWEFCHPETQKPMAPVPTGEDKPLFTETIYGVSKLAEEKISIGLGRAFGIPTVALRYAVTYGPRQSIFNPYTGVVSIFSTQLINNMAPVVYEDGEQTRDYLFVDDNVRANLLVMENPEADFRVFNVGTGIPTSVNRLVSELRKRYGKKLEPRHSGEFRPGDVRHFVHDWSAINKLGFKPEHSIESGLDRYVAWILTQKNVGEYFSRAKATMRSSGVVRSVVP